MAGDLQATLEISVELSTFHNVDLFQRGYYQIRCNLKPPEKYVSCVDVEYRRTNGDYQPDDCLYPALVTPTGLTAVSKTFQILYKNEEVTLADPFIFRLNMLVDSNKLTDQIDQADVQLLVELYFSDAEVGPESPDALVSVSSQILKLHLSSIKGLHHHVPILFDYFHFAVIDITIHAVLVKLSLPDPSILKIPKSSWFSKAPANNRVPTPLFYAKLFGNKPINNVLSTRTPSEERQIKFAYDTHRSLCSTLLSVQVNLLAYFECLSEFLPESQKIQIGSLDFGQRLDSLLLSIESIQNANEVFSQICSDLDNISMELSLVWSQFLESFILNKQVLPHFREEHHRQRIGHFSEAFFVQEFPWDELQISQEQSYQIHQSLGQGIKNSRYYQTIPVVAIECPCLDGDTSSTPIIFEDRFLFTSIHEGASSDSDLEKIELSVAIDGCESKIVAEDETDTIETDINDVPASKDEPNSSFPLSGVMCNGEGAVRETMILDDDLDDGNSNLSKALQEILISQQKGRSSFAQINNKEDHRSKQDCKDNCSVSDNLSACDYLFPDDLRSVESLSEHSKIIDCPILESEYNSRIGQCNEVVSENVHELCSGHDTEKNTDGVNMDIGTTEEIDRSDDTSAVINEKASVDQGNIPYLPGEKMEHDIPIIPIIPIIPNNKFQKIETSISQEEIVDEKSERNDEKLCPENTCQTIFAEVGKCSDKIANSENQNKANEQKTRREQITNNQESHDMENEPLNESDTQRTESENIEANGQELFNESIIEKQNERQRRQTVDETLGRNEKADNDTSSDGHTNQECQFENSEIDKVLDEVLDDEKIGNVCDDNTSDKKETKANDKESHEEHEKAEDYENTAQGSGDELVPLQLNNADGFSDILDSAGIELDLSNAPQAEDISTLGVKCECENNAKESTACGDKGGSQDDASPIFDTEEAHSSSEIPMQEEKGQLVEPDLCENASSEKKQKVSGEMDEKQAVNSELKQSSSVVTFLSAQEDIVSSASSDSPSQDSLYETPRSSQATFSGQSDVVDGNGVQNKHVQQQENKQAQPQSINKKGKKKAHQKGLMITGCLPVNCSGNTSPSFTRGNSVYGGSMKSRFELAKRYMKRQLKFSCQIYSDIGVTAERDPYFSKDKVDGGIDTHLIVCVHGLDGNSGDLRLFRCYLEMALPSTRIDFLMSEINQGDTFVSFEELTERLVQEILHFIDAYSIFPSKISFVGHSLGNIIIRSALAHPCMEPLLDRMHTFLSLSGPHVGMLYPTSPLVSTGLWLMQKWKKSEALTQLSLNDHEDLRQTCIYRLSRSKGLEYFKNVLLVSSVQDHYVPYHSARIEVCKAATKDTSEYGTIYREMISNLLSPLKDKENMTFIRYSCYHALTSSANSFIGRAAHIAMLDSELFIEKLLLVSALDYFR